MKQLTESIPTSNRFEQILYPSYLMGIITNVYILGVLIYVSAFEVMFSPILGNLALVLCFFLMKRGRVSVKRSFIIASYAVVLEVILHTYYLGWDCGFYYYIFLLSIIFLLDPSWKIWMVIWFNGSLIFLTFILWQFFHDIKGIYSIDVELETHINQLNISVVGIVILVIMIHFSHTVDKKDDALLTANFELEKKNKEISQQHQQLQILLKEVHHRVKNNLQLISSLMSLQRHSAEDEEVIDVLNESKRRVEAIALIHQKLYHDHNVNQVDFKSYLEELLVSQQTISSNVKCTINSEQVILGLDTAVPLGLIISEMVTNAFKHAFCDQDLPELTVVLTKKAEAYELIVRDNGVGLPETFDIQASNSLGFEIITALIEQINSKLDYTNDNGAVFKVIFIDRLLKDRN